MWNHNAYNDFIKLILLQNQIFHTTPESPPMEGTYIFRHESQFNQTDFIF